MALAAIQFSACKKDCLANDYVGGFVGDTKLSGTLYDSGDSYIFSPSATNADEVTINNGSVLTNIKASITKTNACQINEGEKISYNGVDTFEVSGSFSLDETGTQLSGAYTVGPSNYTIIATKQ